MDIPPEEVQLKITASSGDEAVAAGERAFKVIRHMMRKHGRPPRDCDAILDFGCGWGRVIRHFDGIENLWGIDVFDAAIQACRETIPFAHFEQTPELGPSPFDDQTFDVIYAYSVFTHLSEEAHLRWLEEFRRILKPGGLVIVTTLMRSFIAHCVQLTLEDPAALAPWQQFAARCFQPSHEFLAAYDRGEYVFSPKTEHFGNTLIPREYVESRWPFELLDWFPSMSQQFVVCRNPS